MINFIISVFFKEVYYVKTNTVFSLSDKGAFITGTDFMCDGGATASYYYGPLRQWMFSENYVYSPWLTWLLYKLVLYFLIVRYRTKRYYMEANELLSVARQIKKLINKKMEPVLADCELKPIEVDILVFLYNHPYVDTSKDIMKIFHLSKAHISHSLDNLRENDYIRLAEDSKDHRIMHIIIEKRAMDIIDKVDKVYCNCKDVIQKEITKDEISVLKSIIHKINDNVEKELNS